MGLGTEQNSLRDYIYHYGLSSTATNTTSVERLDLTKIGQMGYGSNDEDDAVEDTTTTGTGSDSSSLKWVKYYIFLSIKWIYPMIYCFVLE